MINLIRLALWVIIETLILSGLLALPIVAVILLY